MNSTSDYRSTERVTPTAASRAVAWEADVPRRTPYRVVTHTTEATRGRQWRRLRVAEADFSSKHMNEATCTPTLRRAVAPALVLIAASVGTACAVSTAPLEREAVRFEPPAVYSRWWRMVESCSGRSGHLSAVQWYRVPGEVFEHRGEYVGGYWRPRGNQIVLAERYSDDGREVRHEMLHALLQSTAHPRAEYLEACSRVVSCGAGCVRDAGPWVAQGDAYDTVPPRSVHVTSQATLLPRETDGAQYLALTVTATNVTGRHILVAAPAQPESPRGFGYDIRGPAGGKIAAEPTLDPSVMFFRPGETKQWLHEWRVGSELSTVSVSAGRHLVRGVFALEWSAYDTVDVRP